MKIRGFLMIAGVVMIGTSGCEYYEGAAALEESSKEITVEGMKEDTEEIVPPSVSAEELNRLKEQLDQIQAQIEGLNPVATGPVQETPSVPETPPADSEQPEAGSPDLPGSETPATPEVPGEPGDQVGPIEEDTSLEVVGHAPERDQQDVSTSFGRVTIRFSEPVDPTTVTASSLRLSYRVSHDRVSVPVVQVSVIPHPTLVNRIFKFTFASPFLPGKTYRAVVEKDGIRAVSGHTLSGDDSWEFSTVAAEAAEDDSTTSPYVASTSPADGRTNVPEVDVIDVTFSEPVQGVSKESLRFVDCEGDPTKAFLIHVNAVSQTFDGDIRTYHFGLSEKLPPDVKWCFILDQEGIEDLSGNTMPEDHSFWFRTRSAP